MNADRTAAYQRVMHTLEELGPTKLQSDEQDRVRFAADTLIFCTELSEDAAAREALADIRALARALVESERWEQATADQLLADVRACGPEPESRLRAA
jgi:hypothetical protein